MKQTKGNMNNNISNPELPLTKAEELLSEGNADMAMVYFWSAGDGFASQDNWKKAGYCYSKSAYCYEMNGAYEKAAQDYQKAAELYAMGGDDKEAEKTTQLSLEMLKLSHS